MFKFFFLIILIISALHGYSQPKSMAEIKSEMEKSPNSPLYVKDILKKKFKLDTVVVTRTKHFNSLADSLAYTGTIKKVYGPFNMQGQKFLVQILARLPNTFYRISQIFIDTSVFRYRIADSLGKSILAKISKTIRTALNTWLKLIRWAGNRSPRVIWDGLPGEVSFLPLTSNWQKPKRGMYLWCGQTMASILSG